MARAGLRVARDEPKVFGLAALSSLVSLVLIGGAITAVIIFWATAKSAVIEGVPTWLYYVIGAAIGLGVFYLGSFFNAAITYVALRRFDGERVTFHRAVTATARKSGSLLGLAGLTVTIGTVLRMIGDAVPYVGWGASWLGGIAWSVASIFAVQVVMNDDEINPIKAVQKSSSTFTKIWKESVFIGASLGLVSIVVTSALMVVVLGLFVLAITLQTMALAGVALVLLVVVTIILAIIGTALRAIIMSVAYYYAVNGRVPAGFDEELLRKAFRPKRKWLQA